MKSRPLPNDFCELGNHPIPSFSGYVYWDVANGIPEEIRACHRCLTLHVLKHYPDSHFAKCAINDPERFDLLPDEVSGYSNKLTQGKLL